VPHRRAPSYKPPEPPVSKLFEQERAVELDDVYDPEHEEEYQPPPHVNLEPEIEEEEGYELEPTGKGNYRGNKFYHSII